MANGRRGTKTNYGAFMQTAAIFSDNMVVQRGIPIPVWGWAEPGESVTVEITGKSATAKTGKDGRWKTVLPEMDAGGPFEMTVKGSGTKKFNNVMVGEVWICSGQSNMQMAVWECADSDKEIPAAQYPNIRLFTVPNVAETKPARDIKGEWLECSPNTILTFSATAYFFGREIHKNLDVPVGLINTSWGGTRIESWMSKESLLADPSTKKDALLYEEILRNPAQAQQAQKAYRQLLEEYRLWEANNLPEDPGNTGYGQGWADPAFDTKDWKEMYVPQYWQKAGLYFSGVLWFRRDLEIPTELAGEDLVLHLGPCDKTDVTYFNNVEVGRIGKETPNSWAVDRIYTIPGKFVKVGRNTIAVRIMSNCCAGGFAGNAPDMHVSVVGGDSLIRLSGKWQYKVEHNFGCVKVPPPLLPPQPCGNGKPKAPHILYDNMIVPLIPYGIRGVIWYQGESNAEDNPVAYRALLPAMIRDWRFAWQQGDFYFLVVQLPNYWETYWGTPVLGESRWARIREAETMALALPHTGMAVTIDIGEPTDIHPKNKQDVGRRLARAALGTAYGKKIVYSGPLYQSFILEKNRIRISFDHIGSGLLAKGKTLEGFTVAGEDRKFAWANAAVEGKTVVVSSDKVRKPVAVRYAWADNPACNLYNKEGLPSSPFRTDDWET